MVGFLLLRSLTTNCPRKLDKKYKDMSNPALKLEKRKDMIKNTMLTRMKKTI